MEYWMDQLVGGWTWKRELKVHHDKNMGHQVVLTVKMKK